MKRFLKNAKLYGVVALLLILASCENPILFQVEKDVFRATSERFAELTLRKGLSVITDQLVFNGTLIGESTESTLTIQNSGDFDMTLTGITVEGANAADFVVSQEPTQAVVAPSEEVTFKVQFKPVGDTGQRYASLTITYEGGDVDSGSVTMTGEASDGLLPEIEVSYGGEPIVYIAGSDLREIIIPTAVLGGGAAASYEFTIENLGSQQLTFTGVTDAVDASGLFSVNDGGVTSVDQGTPETFTVSFAPTASTTPGKKTAEIQVQGTNDTNETNFTFLLSVYATVPDIGVYRTSLSYPVADGTGTVDFGDTQTDGTPTTVRLYVKNEAPDFAGIDDSAGALTLGTISGLTAPWSLLHNRDGAELLPQQTTYVDVRFSPTADGPYTDTVSITSDDPDPASDSPYTVEVAGTAGTPDIVVEYRFTDPVSGTEFRGRLDNGATIYLGRPGQDAGKRTFSIYVTNPGTATYPLQIEHPDWRNGLFGLPIETDAGIGAFEVAATDLKDAIKPNNTGRADFTLVDSATELAARDYFFKEKVELHTNLIDDPDTVFSFSVAAGRPNVLAVGHIMSEGTPRPAVWQYDLSKGLSVPRVLDTPGTISSGYYTTAGDLVLFGATYTGKYYEAARFNFDYANFKFDESDPFVVVGPADGRGHSIVRDVQLTNGKPIVSGSVGLSPLEEWWRADPPGGFLGVGQDVGEFAGLPEGSAAYATTSTLEEIDGKAAWSYGIGKADDPYRWAGLDDKSAETIQESELGFGLALDADGATSYRVASGHQEARATYWILDDGSRKGNEIVFGGGGTYGFGVQTGGIDVSDPANPTALGYVAGAEYNEVEKVLEAVAWSSANNFGPPIYLGRNDGRKSIAFSALSHVRYGADGDTDFTEVVAAGEYGGRAALFPTVLADPGVQELASEAGRLNRLIPLVPADFYDK